MLFDEMLLSQQQTIIELEKSNKEKSELIELQKAEINELKEENEQIRNSYISHDAEREKWLKNRETKSKRRSRRTRQIWQGRCMSLA